MTSNPSIPVAQSLYRTWRSRGFGEVVGQAHVVQTLRNAVRANSVGHAYLLTGPRGTGKTSTARILARAVNCLDPQDGEPCNRCAACSAIFESRCLDIIEIDAASNNSVEDVRDLRDKVNFAPSEVRRKVYIIDEVHMLSGPAFNALLKTLEEPPPHVMFVLATTDVHKVPATITSRCQRLDFRTIAPRDIVGRLAYVCTQEGMVADEAALELIAQQATGSLRDALSLLDQVRAYEGETIGVAEVEAALGLARSDTLGELTELVVDGDIGAVLLLISDLSASGADMRQYAKQLVQYWRDLLLYRAGGAAVLGRTPDARMSALAERVDASAITAMLKALLQPDYSGRRSASAQWQLELALAEACQQVAPAAGTPAQRRAARPPVSREQARSSISSPEPIAAEPLPSRASSESAINGRPATAQVEKPAVGELVTSREEVVGDDSSSRAGRVAQVPQVSQTFQSPQAPLATAPVNGAHGPNPQPLVRARPALPPQSDGRSVQQIWAEVRRRLAASDDEATRRVAKLFGDGATPLGLEQDSFVVGFQGELMRGQADKPRNRGVVEAALGQVLGRTVTLRCDTIKPSSSTQGGSSGTVSESFIDKAERYVRGLHIERDPTAG